MDNQWGPPAAGIVAIGVLGVLMTVGCVTLGADPQGRIIAGIAAVGMLAFAIGSWRARPRLAITAGGLVYRGWFGNRTLTRDQLELIRITEFRRWGRKVRLLELDLKDGQLLVLSRWDLGEDPLAVLDALTDAGYAGRPRG